MSLWWVRGRGKEREREREQICSASYWWVYEDIIHYGIYIVYYILYSRHIAYGMRFGPPSDIGYYIYIERERDRERERDTPQGILYMGWGVARLPYFYRFFTNTNSFQGALERLMTWPGKDKIDVSSLTKVFREFSDGPAAQKSVELQRGKRLSDAPEEATKKRRLFKEHLGAMVEQIRHVARYVFFQTVSVGKWFHEWYRVYL